MAAATAGMGASWARHTRAAGHAPREAGTHVRVAVEVAAIAVMHGAGYALERPERFAFHVPHMWSWLAQQMYDSSLD